MFPLCEHTPRHSHTHGYTATTHSDMDIHDMQGAAIMAPRSSLAYHLHRAVPGVEQELVASQQSSAGVVPLSQEGKALLLRQTQYVITHTLIPTQRSM